MQRPSRETSIFNMSALDLLAMATGTFVLIVVILLPYYRKEFDAHAEILDLKAATETQSAEAEDILQAAVAEARAAAQMKSEAEQMRNAAAEARAAAASLRQEADQLDAQGGKTEKKAEKKNATLVPKTIEKLDLIIVIDTTSSMVETLKDLRLSIHGLIRILERLVPSLRIGVVAYRDHDFGTWVTRSLQPTSTERQPKEIYDFVGRLKHAARGGPTPREAVHAGLNRAVSMSLRQDAQQTIILVGDAGPHKEKERSTLLLVKRFAEGGPNRNVSAHFVETRSYRSFGTNDRNYFKKLAEVGRGEFSDQRGSMIEKVLLAVLKE
ncbi:MAG: vWA domain-containing protein [Kiloniellales bacterium]|nr:vWA domain-containing protein [Kiloniellales bacterium]